MTRLIGPYGQEYRLVGPEDLADRETCLEFPDEYYAFTFLSGLAEDPINLTALRRSAEADGLTIAPVGVDDTQLLKNIASELISGRVRLLKPGEWVDRLRAPARQTASSGGETRDDDAEEEEAAAPTESDELTWIKFQVLDHGTGEPVRGVTLQVKLTTGKTKKGRTDGLGMIEFTDIPSGSCDIVRMIDPDALEVVSVN